MSRWRQTWLPSVITSAPAARILSASFAVSPTPSAAFSPFTTQKPAPSSSRSAAQPSLQRPPARGAEDVCDEEDDQCGVLVLGHGERAGRVHLDVHVLAAVLGVARECGLLDRRKGR